MVGIAQLGEGMIGGVVPLGRWRVGAVVPLVSGWRVV